MSKRNPGSRLEWREDRRCWEIAWYERGARKRRSTGTTSRENAERMLAEHIVESQRETIGPRDPAQRSIADALADYATEHGPRVASPETLSYCIEALVPFWGARMVRDVREGTCRAYVAHRDKGGASASTAGRELAVLSAAIRHDWKAGRLTEVVPIWKPPARQSPRTAG